MRPSELAKIGKWAAGGEAITCCPGIQIEILLIDLPTLNIEVTDPPFLFEGGGSIAIWMATSGSRPILPISDVRFNGEFRRDSGLLY